MKNALIALAIVFAAGGAYAQAGTAVKEAGKATAETAKQGSESAKAATSSTLRLRPMSHLPRITFCWLPPLRLSIIASGEPLFTLSRVIQAVAIVRSESWRTIVFARP